MEQYMFVNSVVMAQRYRRLSLLTAFAGAKPGHLLTKSLLSNQRTLLGGFGEVMASRGV